MCRTRSAKRCISEKKNECVQESESWGEKMCMRMCVLVCAWVLRAYLCVYLCNCVYVCKKGREWNREKERKGAKMEEKRGKNEEKARRGDFQCACVRDILTRDKQKTKKKKIGCDTIGFVQP